MANKYLDLEGVQRLVSKLKTYISNKMDTPVGGTKGQVLTKTSSGYEWDDVDTLNVSVSNETLYIN